MFEFKNLDLCSFYDIDSDLPISTDKSLKNLAFTAVNTFDRNSQCSQEEFFYQKSTQNLTDSYQISFEKDFMKEHTAVYQRYLQNYMESFGTSGKIRQGQNKQITKMEQKNSLNSIEFIRSRKLTFSFEEAQNFINKFTTYDKLFEFLNFVVSSSPEHISVELVRVAKELLQKYQETKLSNPSHTQLIQIANNFAECEAELTNLKVVSDRGTQSKESLDKFLQVFCVTVMLVVDQYFQNPYSQKELGGFKRQLSPSDCEDESEEVQQGSIPSKKRKFSF